MVRPTKPQRAQRITASCYFSLLPYICSSAVFQNLISKVSKSLRDFETLLREIPGTIKVRRRQRYIPIGVNMSIGRIKGLLDGLQIKGE